MDAQPRIRVRVSHSKTQRDGWGYETTVEIDSEMTDALQEELRKWLEIVRNVGEYERGVRNARDKAGVS